MPRNIKLRVVADAQKEKDSPINLPKLEIPEVRMLRVGTQVSSITYFHLLVMLVHIVCCLQKMHVHNHACECSEIIASGYARSDLVCRYMLAVDWQRW